MAAVAFVVPDAIDDPERVSGGNVYDRRVRDGLRAAGWDVRMLHVTDRGSGWTHRALARLSDGALVLLDGLLAAREPEAVAAHARRLRLVVIAHMAPDDAQLAVYRVARRVIATSQWTRTALVAVDGADPSRVVVAWPGADRGAISTPSPTGGRLLCVAAVAPHKGIDVLVRALAALADEPSWTCTIVGSLHLDPDFVSALASVVDSTGLGDRIRFRGALDGDRLEAAYCEADLLVLPSRSESYGMVLAEALAHGVPVLTTDVGGVAEAIPRPDAAMTVPPDDAWALRVVLRQWLGDPSRRKALASAARAARDLSWSWGSTVSTVGAVLGELADEKDAVAPPPPSSFGTAAAR
ncbi:glycosyltransferase family 4 protein [Leifsonia sp. AG29]|uniref:glycosyltransferase family 4 protein n=1 Tax=Leifsonia sp. AG29 TaxID=2598860 RepID=UPI00131C976C|nr:glycosyltransferase family 4 protein [Leifsonia sp. AG29]